VTVPPAIQPALQSLASHYLIPDSLERPGDDPIFALHAEAQRRARAGESILNATLGALMEDDGRLAVMTSVFEAFAKVPPERAAAYAPIAGEPKFLAAVVRDLFGSSGLAPHAIAVATPGGTGALHHAIVNFLEPGQSLLTTSYYWSPYQILAEHTRRGVETFPMFDAAGRFDLGAFERALRANLARQRRALILLNSPCHNPTGYSFDAAEWRGLVAVVRSAIRESSQRPPVALLVDHAYARFGAEGSDSWVREIEQLCGEALVLVAWTASKAFTQYGARIGALVAVHPDPEARRRIASALSYSCRGTWSNCNHLGMLAITEMLDDPSLRQRARAERQRLRELLGERVRAFNAAAERAGLRHPRYEGGFFVTVFTRDGEATARSLRERGVYVVPLQGAVRVALCSTPAAEVPRLVSALAEGVR
jgi:aromatic-amino-acid transaminase